MSELQFQCDQAYVIFLLFSYVGNCSRATAVPTYEKITWLIKPAVRTAVARLRFQRQSSHWNRSCPTAVPVFNNFLEPLFNCSSSLTEHWNRSRTTAVPMVS